MNTVTTSYGSDSTSEQANFHHLVVDIVWFGLAMAATSRFLSLYAIRLGASPEQLNWLAALPGIALLLSAGLSGWWRRRYPDTIQAIKLPGLTFRLVFLLPAFAPFFPMEWQPIWLILAVSLTALPQGIAGAIFIVLMRETVSAKRMTTLLSRRTLMMNLAIAAGALAFGVMLEKVPFPYNYQLMFGVAFLFTLISYWHVVSVRVIFPEPPPPPKRRDKAARIWHSPRFIQVAFITFIIHAAFFSVIMIAPLRMVEDLNAGEGFIAMFGMAELIAGASVAVFTDRIIRSIGSRALVAASMLATALSALLIALAPSLELTLVAALLSGGAWAAASIGIFAFLLENTPDGDSTPAAVAFQQLIAAGIFVGPMLGNILVDWNLSLVDILIAGAILRLLAAALTHYNLLDVFMRHPRLYDKLSRRTR